LRATALMAFAGHYLAVGGDEAKQYVVEKLYDSRLPSETVIKNDLEYVANTWSEIGFDIWEEVRQLAISALDPSSRNSCLFQVNGMHFFTLLVSLRALREGCIVQHLLLSLIRMADLYLFRSIYRCRIRH
jgi:glucoamylase